MYGKFEIYVFILSGLPPIRRWSQVQILMGALFKRDGV